MEDLYCPSCGRQGKVMLHGFDMVPYVLKPSGHMGCLSEEQRYIISYSCYYCGANRKEHIVPSSFIKGIEMTLTKEITTPLSRFLNSQKYSRCNHFMLNEQCRLCEGFKTSFCPCNGDTDKCKLLINVFNTLIKKED